jgi:HemY protein
VKPELAAQDNSPPTASAEPVVLPAPAAPPQPVPQAPSPQPEPQPAIPAPLFRSRIDLAKAGSAPTVIPILRPPDDPGVDDEAPSDEFVEQIGTPKAQAGGWRGFLSRWGG